MTPRILIFAGSNRSGAFSAKAADAATKALALKGAEVTRISLIDYPLPIFDQDLESEEGIPKYAVQIAALMASHDGVVIASPEYNASLTPLLKNTLDWVSRVKEGPHGPLQPYQDKLFALVGSSPGALGGMRALEHLRVVLRNCGAEVITKQVAIGSASKAYDDDGHLTNERQAAMLDGVCDSLLRQIRAQKMLEE